MTNDFKEQADSYSLFRPTYPAELFEWLASVTPGTGTAVDCATGNGQAAIALTKYFDKVIAADIHAEQLDKAIRDSKIQYILAPAEKLPLKDNSTDLITVACGVHWFQRDKFYDEVKRILKSDAIIAVWTYIWPTTGSVLVDQVLIDLKERILAPYWPPESKLYLSGYRNLEFPFDEIEPPKFSIKCYWGASELFGFIETWSVFQRYKREQTGSILENIKQSLDNAWQSEPPRIPIELPLYFRIGHIRK